MMQCNFLQFQSAGKKQIHKSNFALSYMYILGLAASIILRFCISECAQKARLSHAYTFLAVIGEAAKRRTHVYSRIYKIFKSISALCVSVLKARISSHAERALGPPREIIRCACCTLFVAICVCHRFTPCHFHYTPHSYIYIHIYFSELSLSVAADAKGEKNIAPRSVSIILGALYTLGRRSHKYTNARIQQHKALFSPLICAQSPTFHSNILI